MRRPPDSRVLSFAVATAACGLAALVGTLLPPPYLYTPFLTAYVAVLISASFGGRAAGLFAVGLSAILTTGMLMMPGGHATAELDWTLAARLTGYIAVSATLALFVAGLVSARNRTEQALERSRADLEHRVADRTAELSAVIATLQEEIARRQRMTEALQLSEESYRTLADNFPGGAVLMFDTDLRLRMAYGVELNEVGLPREVIEGKTIFEAYPPEILAIAEPAYRAALAGERRLLEVPLAGRIYEVTVLPIRGDRRDVVGGMALVQNVTKHKRLEEDLRQRTAELEAVFEAIPDLLFRIAGDGTFAGYYAASSAEPALPPSEFLGRRIRDVLPDPPASQLEEALAEVFRTGAERLVEYRLPPPREEGVFEARLLPFPGGQVLAMVRDITERKRSEQAAQQSQAELAHVFRVATMGEMAAGLAHELNQPLQAIVNFATGCTRRIQAGSAKADDLLEPLHEMATEALRAGDVIRRLRTLVRREEPRRQTVSLCDVIHEAVHLIDGDVHLHGVRLQCECDAGLPAVEIDPVQIEQVLLNLMRNGLDAMAQTSPASRVLSIHASCPDPATVEIAVTDTGAGFPAEQAEAIFAPFHTTKPSGMGMGLSISRSIVEAHGGRLWASANAAAGATFRFTLPVGQRPA